MIVAKPVVNDKFWIVKDGEVKIGEIKLSPAGVQVSVNSTRSEFRTVSLAAERLGINVKNDPVPETHVNLDFFEGLPVNALVFNPSFNLKYRVPVFTKEKDSKCFYAAGWYKIKSKKDFVWVLCPKLLKLQRYEWRGPFKDKNELS